MQLINRGRFRISYHLYDHVIDLMNIGEYKEYLFFTWCTAVVRFIDNPVDLWDKRSIVTTSSNSIIVFNRIMDELWLMVERSIFYEDTY